MAKMDSQAELHFRIQELEKERAEMLKALKPFADAIEHLKGGYADADNVAIWDTGAENHIRVGDLKRARAFLNKTEESDE